MYNVYISNFGQDDMLWVASSPVYSSCVRQWTIDVFVSRLSASVDFYWWAFFDLCLVPAWWC